MKVTKHILYLGLNDKDTKKQRISTKKALDIITNKIAVLFDGGSVYRGNGVYKHDDKQTVIENTVRIELLFASDDKVKNFCQDLKTLFNQESVAFEKASVNSELI